MDTANEFSPICWHWPEKRHGLSNTSRMRIRNISMNDGWVLIVSSYYTPGWGNSYIIMFRSVISYLCQNRTSSSTMGGLFAADSEKEKNTHSSIINWLAINRLIKPREINLDKVKESEISMVKELLYSVRKFFHLQVQHFQHSSYWDWSVTILIYLPSNCNSIYNKCTSSSYVNTWIETLYRMI